MIQKYAPTLSYTPMSALVQFNVVHSRKLVENNWHTEQKTYNTLHKTYTYKVWQVRTKNNKGHAFNPFMWDFFIEFKIMIIVLRKN